MLVQYPLHRFTHFFIGPMDTADPAAWAALTLGQFFGSSLYVVGACFGTLDSNRPANPLIAGQGRNLTPCLSCFRTSLDGLLHISWELMNRAICQGLAATYHKSIVLYDDGKTLGHY